MKIILHSSLKTGVRVFRLTSGPLPNIGDLVIGKNFKARVLDIIGPIQEPFLVLKPLGKDIPKEVDVRIAKGKKSRR